MNLDITEAYLAVLREEAREYVEGVMESKYSHSEKIEMLIHNIVSKDVVIHKLQSITERFEVE